jgi:hypothetical protein
MAIYKLKCCPRCHGDIVIDSDTYGWYELCLQCGYMADIILRNTSLDWNEAKVSVEVV